MTYLAEYAATGRSSCHGLECTEKGIAEGQLRIGIGNSQTVWYHVDCFFKHLVELGPKNLKLQSFRGFVMKRGELKEEDQKQLDEKIVQCHKDKANRKRKAEEDINDRYAKIAKMDLPPLFTDNLIELLCRFSEHELLTTSRVNKQFCAISRKILFTREISVSNKTIHASTTSKLLPFVMQIRKLKIQHKISPSKEEVVTYNQIISQLTNLQSLDFGQEGSFIMSGIEQLTQLRSIDFCVTDAIHYQKPSAKLILPAFDNFKELKEVSLSAGTNFGKVLTDELSPVMTQLTSLKLQNIDMKPLRNFTNLEHLDVKTVSQASAQFLVPADAFELPRLTSLRTKAINTDFTKFTQLKRLILLGGRFEGVPLALPPNIEQLSLLPAPLPDVFPSTLKIVRVGASGNAAFYKSLQSLSDECSIELHYRGFVITPPELLNRENLTVVISTGSYGTTGWDSVSKYLNGTLPPRLHIQFYQWHNCRFKPKLLELLKKVESKIRLLVDFVNHGHQKTLDLMYGYDRLD